MLNAYNKRPHNFRRKILKRCHTIDCRVWEQYFLDMVRDDELFYKNKKYYNIKRFATGGDITSCLPNRQAIIKKRYGKKHSDGIKKSIRNRSPEKKALHRQRHLKSLLKTLQSSTYINYQDRPFKVFVNGILYKQYRNKQQFIVENKCDRKCLCQHLEVGKWEIRHKNRSLHPFAIGDILTFEFVNN